MKGVNCLVECFSVPLTKSTSPTGTLVRFSAPLRLTITQPAQNRNTTHSPIITVTSQLRPSISDNRRKKAKVSARDRTRSSAKRRRHRFLRHAPLARVRKTGFFAATATGKDTDPRATSVCPSRTVRKRGHVSPLRDRVKGAGFRGVVFSRNRREGGEISSGGLGGTGARWRPSRTWSSTGRRCARNVRNAGPSQVCFYLLLLLLPLAPPVLPLRGFFGCFFGDCSVRNDEIVSRRVGINERIWKWSCVGI